MDAETLQNVLKQQDAYILEFDEIRKNCLDSLKQNLSKSYYTTCIELLQTLFEKFKTNHFNILLSTDKNSTTHYTEQNYYPNIQKEYIDLVSKLKTKCDPPAPQEPVITIDDSRPQDNPSPTLVTSYRPSFKLPYMQIPTFSGDYKSWRTFRDMFCSLIHNSPEIPKVQKMHYLKSCVSGEAQKILKQFDVTESNYEQAWQTLEKRFSNNKLLINMHLTQLFKLPSVKSEGAHSIKALIDNTEEALHELRTLKVNTDNWDPILVHLLIQKLPPETHELWEQMQGSNNEYPSYQELIKFLESRFRVLESLEGSIITKNKVFLNNATKTNTNNTRCLKCKKDHTIYQCIEFKKLDNNERWNFVKNSKLCSNCLAKSHSTSNCTSKYSCKFCNRRHNSLLHSHRQSQVPQIPSQVKPSTSTQNLDPPNTDGNLNVKSFLSSNFQHALLSTALVLVYNDRGQHQKLRALIDSGSQVSFITASAAKRLQLNLTKTQQQISGLEKNHTTIANSKTSFLVKSHTSPYEIKVNALVIKSITNWLPTLPIDISKYAHITNLTLADPNFNTPGRIDLLLGSDIYANIIKDGVIKSPNQPTAQNSELGWIIMGNVEGSATSVESFFIQSNSDLENQLRKFWEIEEQLTQKPRNNDDEKCEAIYKNTTIRLPNGKYQVSLPFKNEKGPELGQTRHKALKQFFSLENKFERDPEYHKLYSASINEYMSLGQMIEVPAPKENQVTYYMPHHGVIKESSTTKLRPVFNASCPSTNGKTLNEQMFVGPTIQPTLYTTLIRYRLFKYAMTADIEKMYRMIYINPNHYNYQRILWRNSNTEPLKDYALITVTFGTSAAPFLAIRTIHQLADDEGKNYPKAAVLLKKSLYVDDLCCSLENLEEAKIIQFQLRDILKKGGFHLRKWTANHHELLAQIPEEDRELKGSLDLLHTLNVKTLGIQWSPASDNFTFNVKLPASKIKYTKRSILSEIASLFDPFGWIAPCIMIAKRIMQELWMCGCAWDDVPPDNIAKKWLTFRENLTQITTIKIPRWIKYKSKDAKVTLHGFCDASILGYAAVVYTRVQYAENVYISLLVAKTKVAPIKPVSLPRLELCSAVLLSRVIKSLISDIDISNLTYTNWTDSLITLSWIQGHAHKWKTFVANRVAEIQDNTTPSTWRHIPGTENPADCASRGQMPTLMINNSSWWNAPSWLHLNEEHWPQQPKSLETTEEMKKPKAFSVFVEPDFILKYSSYSKLLRVIAYCIRFIKNSAHKILKISKTNKPYLTVTEINHSETQILKIIQKSHFNHEITNLKENKPVNKKSKLLSLNPFLDKQGLLRVGGRLTNSHLSYNSKHPIILPNNHHVTKILIDHVHNYTLHGGMQLTLNSLRNRFWILNAKTTIKFQIHKCITCFKSHPKFNEQMMTDLPESRVTQSLPFEHVGIDFAGPFDMKISKLRNSKTIPAYLCLYICLSTKAVHLELVTDMTAEAFIASFRRFTSRRGLCTNIYSDCGTNFVKANKILFTQREQEKIGEKLSNDKVNWHFNPPSAPHFGGLWESGVKLVKTHLKKVLKTSKCTYEELSTLFCQIEAIINSRPYVPINIDTENHESLTPGHLITGRNIKTLPEDKNLDNVPPTRRWQYIQHIYKQFWSNWSSEYLRQQQQRYKWQIPQENLKIGDIVIVKNDHLLPLQWPIGKIQEIYPSKDNLVRTVTVKIGDKLFLRPTVKLAKLPIETDPNTIQS